MVLTYAQLDTLRTFVATTLAGGSLPFLFPSQINGANITVRFAENLPAWQRYGWGKVTVNIDLETLP